MEVENVYAIRRMFFNNMSHVEWYNANGNWTDDEDNKAFFQLGTAKDIAKICSVDRHNANACIEVTKYQKVITIEFLEVTTFV